MTKVKVVACVLMVVAVVALAAHDGGPRTMGEPRMSRLFGSDPAPPPPPPPPTKSDCNGNSLADTDCPNYTTPAGGLNSCGDKYRDITPVLLNVLKERVYDNDEKAPACRNHPTCGNLFAKKLLKDPVDPTKDRDCNKLKGP